MEEERSIFGRADSAGGRESNEAASSSPEADSWSDQTPAPPEAEMDAERYAYSARRAAVAAERRLRSDAGIRRLMLRRETRRKMLMLMVLFPLAGVATLIAIRLAYGEELYTVSSQAAFLRAATQPFLLIGLVIMSMSAAAFLYLDSGFLSPRPDQPWSRLEQEISDGPTSDEASFHRNAAAMETEMRFARMEAQVAELRNLSDSRGAVTEDDHDRLVSTVYEQIRGAGAAAILGDIRASVQKQAEQEQWLGLVEHRFQQAFMRLRQEVQALGRRGNLNLVLGSATTVVGLGLLGYFVLVSGVDVKDTQTLAVRFVPRLSLVLFIEIFAYFFLRLYKSSLSEIKYFQNEITNMELKAVSLLAAAATASNGNAESLHKTIEAFANAERNRILEKGQTTVELRRELVENSTLTSTLRELVSVLKARLDK